MEALHISPVFGARSGFGGMATSTEYLCSELARLGVDVTVMTTEATRTFQQDGGAQSDEGDGRPFRTIRLQVAPTCLQALTGMYYTPSFHTAFEREAAAADIVHIHGFRSYQNFAAEKPIRKYGLRYILQPHGSAVRGYGKGLLKSVYDYAIGIRQATHAEALIASTGAEALQLENLGVRSSRIHIIPNGVYRETWDREPKNPSLFRDTVHVSPSAPVALYVGRLDSTKGLDILIESFKAVLDQVPDAVLVLLGPDFGARSRLEAQARRMGLENFVVFAGQANQDLVRAAYKESTVVVIPSTYESFSLVALEAAAAGAPIIMTEACGLAITFGRAGLTVVKGDSYSVSNAILRFVRDERFRNSQQVALNGLPWERFSWREIARAVLALYEEGLRG